MRNNPVIFLDPSGKLWTEKIKPGFTTDNLHAAYNSLIASLENVDCCASYFVKLLGTSPEKLKCALDMLILIHDNEKVLSAKSEFAAAGTEHGGSIIYLGDLLFSQRPGYIVNILLHEMIHLMGFKHGEGPFADPNLDRSCNYDHGLSTVSGTH